MTIFDFSFYKGKRVFVTGHTGFKGSWLCKILVKYGAIVTGYSLPLDNTSLSLFELSGVKNKVNSIYGDIRNFKDLQNALQYSKADIVFHLAAQPIVKEGYKDPVYTYETNVMGTVNLLECVRLNGNIKSVVNVTTDKVYLNKEWVYGYRENDELDGYDPYSNSKSCSELVTHSYKNSFFNSTIAPRIAVSTARAGNVIGGGDFAPDRIIPDCIRAAIKKQDIIVRNPYSTRPYQHVLEPLFAYLLIAGRQYEDPSVQGFYNVGPDEVDCYTTGALADLFTFYWGNEIKWINKSDNGPHEANYLKLDCAKIKSILNWAPRWNLPKAVEKTVEWTKCWINGGNISECMERQIDEFLIK